MFRLSNNQFFQQKKKFVRAKISENEKNYIRGKLYFFFENFNKFE